MKLVGLLRVLVTDIEDGEVGVTLYLINIVESMIREPGTLIKSIALPIIVLAILLAKPILQIINPQLSPGADALKILLLSITPLTTPLAIATPLIIIARPVIAHRLLLNTPLEQLTATITARLPREAKTLLILAIVASTLKNLTGLVPIE